jgi:hypothetical protein
LEEAPLKPLKLLEFLLFGSVFPAGDIPYALFESLVQLFEYFEAFFYLVSVRSSIPS